MTEAPVYRPHVEAVMFAALSGEDRPRQVLVDAYRRARRERAGVRANYMREASLHCKGDQRDYEVMRVLGRISAHYKGMAPFSGYNGDALAMWRSIAERIK